MEEFLNEIPGATVSESFSRRNFGPEVNFYNFLRAFQTEENRRILLFLDEIEKAPSVSSLLHLWRKVFHQRNDQPELRKYSVVIAGAADLIALTLGPTSPFNIAQKLYLEELSENESRELIEKPLEKLDLKIEAAATRLLIEQTQGHPQLLQFLCSRLVETASGGTISRENTKDALESLFHENDNLRSLDLEFRQNQKLEELVKRLLNDEDVDSVQYHELTISGVGPIANRAKKCVIRNPVYREFFSKVSRSGRIKPEASNGTEYHIAFYTKRLPNLETEVSERHFLKSFFDFDDIEFVIHKNAVVLPEIELDFKEKAMFCYLAYKNYKARKQGYSDWKKIPSTYEFRLSSTVAHNEKMHVPEWKLFVEALGRDPYGEDIRAWIFSLRRELEKIDAGDLIYSDPGRGRGYIMKGSVSFTAGN